MTRRLVSKNTGETKLISVFSRDLLQSAFVEEFLSPKTIKWFESGKNMQHRADRK